MNQFPYLWLLTPEERRMVLTEVSLRLSASIAKQNTPDITDEMLRAALEAVTKPRDR